VARGGALAISPLLSPPPIGDPISRLEQSFRREIEATAASPEAAEGQLRSRSRGWASCCATSGPPHGVAGSGEGDEEEVWKASSIETQFVQALKDTLPVAAGGDADTQVHAEPQPEPEPESQPAPEPEPEPQPEQEVAPGPEP
jgi:hypothetical protein